MAAASTFSSATPSAPSKSAFLEVRDHVVIEDRLAFGVGQERRLETGRGVELHLAMLERWVDVEEDREPVVEAAPADAPLVDERASARLGLLGGHAEVGELGVDDDLRRGPRLDGIDRRLGFRDRRIGQDAGVVVDRLALHRIGVGRPSGRGRDRQQQGDRRADGQQSSAGVTAHHTNDDGTARGPQVLGARRRRSSSRLSRLLGRPSPLTAMIPGRTSVTMGGGVWST